MTSSEPAGQPSGGPEGKPEAQADRERTEALAAQVADLRGRLLLMEARKDSASPAEVTKVKTEMAILRGQFDDLARLVAETLEAIETEADMVPALDWSRMTGEEAGDWLDDLGIWVTGILLGELESYCASVVKGCWRNHRAAVWELGNLHQEWKRIYGSDNPPLADALTWFDRWLPGVQIRLRDQMSACNPKAGCTAAKAAAAGQERRGL